MDNYTQWRQNKLYEGHIRRLRVIHHTPSPTKTANNKKIFKPSVSSQRPTNTNEHHTIGLRSARKCTTQMKEKPPITSRERLPTQSIRKSHNKTYHSNKMFFPAPLLPGQESQLVRAALSSKTLALKDKEQLLENYLLSRRILSTKTSIKSKQDAQSFRFHRKVSKNMSRPQKLSQAYSSERTDQFKKFQKQTQPQRVVLGKGKSKFEFIIKNILLIKGVVINDPLVVYNISVMLGKRKYEARALSYEAAFTKPFELHFKKSILISNPEVSIFLSVVRSNFEQQIGVFKPVISHFEQNQSGVYKITKGKFPVGTIELVGSASYNQNKETVESDGGE